MRVAGFCLLMILPLGLVSLLPQSGANSQPISPLAYNVFATRWPSADAFMHSVSAKSDIRSIPSAAQTVGADARQDTHPAVDRIALAVEAAPEAKAYALASQHPPQDDAASRAQTAHNSQKVARLLPQPRPADIAPVAQAKTELIEFATAPFPYEGVVPGTEQPFLNVVEGEQKGHRTSRGAVLWEDETFNDNRVLVHIPSGFDINRPAVMVVFFHGHGANLTRDVLEPAERAGTDIAVRRECRVGRAAICRRCGRLKSWPFLAAGRVRTLRQRGRQEAGRSLRQSGQGQAICQDAGGHRCL